ALRSAAADFSQQDFPVAGAIDGNPTTGWAVYPEVGRPHVAVFELGEALRSAGGARLMITLDCLSQFGQHQLGRFRLSTTSAPDSIRSVRLPADVQAILARAPGERTEAERAAVRTHYRTRVAP